MRVSGWANLLAKHVDAHQSAQYKLGEQDCLRFCCEGVALMTGKDFWPEFSGLYSDRKTVIALIRKHGRDLRTAVGSVTQFNEIPLTCVKRGDLLMYSDEGGDHFGLSVGSTAAVLTEGGLEFVPISACAVAWGVD